MSASIPSCLIHELHISVVLKLSEGVSSCLDMSPLAASSSESSGEFREKSQLHLLELGSSKQVVLE